MISIVKKCPYCGEHEMELNQAIDSGEIFWFCEACGSYYTEEEIEALDDKEGRTDLH